MASQDRSPLSSDRSQRSAEEREQARQERARRRAQRGQDPAAPSSQPRAEPAVDRPQAASDNQSGARAAAAVDPAAVPPQAPLCTPRPLTGFAPPARRPRRARLAALLALAVAAFCVWFGISLLQPFAGAGSGAVIVSIPQGASAGRIGSILARDQVVPSGFFFDLRALLEGKRGQLRSGRFQLRRHMSYAAAIAALSTAPVPIAVRVVIPEGFTRLQIAALAQKDGLSGSYLQASESSPLLDPVRFGAPAGVASLEGFLFPATYQLIAGEPARQLVVEQLRAFQLRFGRALVHRAHVLGLSPYQLLIVASMIEREAQVPRDRALIAAVIYNRLRLGMALGIDATLYYALALREGIGAYDSELTAADLRMQSPYNTRLHAGLPPTPIANPGMASIEAAAHPANVSYLYYVAAPDGCGEHVFSSSYAQFQADAAAYQAALRANGGHLPSCKRK